MPHDHTQISLLSTEQPTSKLKNWQSLSLYRLKHISMLCLKCATTKALHLVTLILSTFPHTDYNTPLPRWPTNYFNYVHTPKHCFVTVQNSPTLRHYTELF